VPVLSATAQQALDALAARLREIRKDAELTARQVAQAAGWHESKCSRIENARTIPSPADIRTWCKICGVPDQATDLTASLRAIESMYVEWRRQIPAGMRRLQEASLPLYARTRQFRIYEPGVIPGLFQTAAYARARMGRIVEFNGIPTTWTPLWPPAWNDSASCAEATTSSRSCWRNGRCGHGSAALR
jgi:transcriptional regulator with XRE-family HTH domain